MKLSPYSVANYHSRAGSGGIPHWDSLSWALGMSRSNPCRFAASLLSHRHIHYLRPRSRSGLFFQVPLRRVTGLQIFVMILFSHYRHRVRLGMWSGMVPCVCVGTQDEPHSLTRPCHVRDIYRYIYLYMYTSDRAGWVQFIPNCSETCHDLLDSFQFTHVLMAYIP